MKKKYTYLKISFNSYTCSKDEKRNALAVRATIIPAKANPTILPTTIPAS